MKSSRLRNFFVTDGDDGRHGGVLALVENLKVVNARFKTLYNERFNRDFAMEIEFKITESGKISIKQARPYVN